MTAPPFQLGSKLDLDRARSCFAARRRAHIPDFLAGDCATAIYEALSSDRRWNLVTTIAGRHVDLDAAAMAAQSEAEKSRFAAHVLMPAKVSGFQYLFENIPIYDAWHRGGGARPLLDALFLFLNSPDLLDFARRVTGAGDIGFADAQATRYGPGHFLTEHDDAIAGKDRRAAYVFGLTPQWRADDGGLTLFIGPDGHVEEAFTPRFNALNIFSVPQRHAVSAVAPFAPGYRYAITGWFRAGADPGLRAA